MAKVAKLVYVTLLTRVVVEDSDSDDVIVNTAIPSLVETLRHSAHENLDMIKNDTECPYRIGEEYDLHIDDDVLMPDPKEDGTDSWQFGDFVGRIRDFNDYNGVIHITVEDGDGDCFEIEASRVKKEWDN